MNGAAGKAELMRRGRARSRNSTLRHHLATPVNNLCCVATDVYNFPDPEPTTETSGQERGYFLRGDNPKSNYGEQYEKADCCMRDMFRVFSVSIRTA
jgi:hypothetical protein